MNDWRLLREYADKKSEAAFGRLVDKYMTLVYWTCRRDTRDDQLAEDATQAVFLLLAQKAASLPREASISGWLFNTARLVSRNAVRREALRKKIEQEAAQAMQYVSSSETEWTRIEPWLNDALASLTADERQTVLLRYFTGLSLQETAVELGITNKTVSKRALRAVEKIRNYLRKKEIVVTVGALAAILDEHTASQALPLDIAHAVTLPAIHTFAAGPSVWSTVGASIAVLQKGVFFTMQAIRYKALIAAAAVIIVAGGVSFPIAALNARPSAHTHKDNKRSPIDRNGLEITSAAAMERREADSAHMTFDWDFNQTSMTTAASQQEMDKTLEATRKEALKKAKLQGITDPKEIATRVKEEVQMTRAGMQQNGKDSRTGTCEFVRDGDRIVTHDTMREVGPSMTSGSSHSMSLDNDLCVAVHTIDGLPPDTAHFRSFPVHIYAWHPKHNAARGQWAAAIPLPFGSEILSLLAGTNPLKLWEISWTAVSSTDSCIVLQAERSPDLNHSLPVRLTLDRAHDNLPSEIDCSIPGSGFTRTYKVKDYTRFENKWVCSKVIFSVSGSIYNFDEVWTLRSIRSSKPESLTLPASGMVIDYRLLGKTDSQGIYMAYRASDPRVKYYELKGSLPSEDELAKMPHSGQN